MTSGPAMTQSPLQFDVRRRLSAAGPEPLYPINGEMVSSIEVSDPPGLIPTCNRTMVSDPECLTPPPSERSELGPRSCRRHAFSMRARRQFAPAIQLRTGSDFLTIARRDCQHLEKPREQGVRRLALIYKGIPAKDALRRIRL